ncbi:MAG: hypothetical protein IPM98_19450 [Lewinellaceae bacterium]|nr:hypothetical protein [Lewinellaceae bacterium]
MRTFVLLLVLLPALVLAQAGKGPLAPRLALKANLMPLINPAKQAVALAADLRVAPRFGVDVGVGYVFNSTNFARFKGESYQGMRWRAGAKYFLDLTPDLAFHIGFEAKYNDITNIQIKRVLRQGGQYIELLEIDRKVRTTGYALRLGWQFYSGPDKRFLVEPFLGFGVATHRVTRNLPPDAELLETGGDLFSFEYEPGKTSTPDMLLGVYLGYAFW